MIKDGIFNINKPQGMTSAQVVGAVKRILDVKKVGHTGTLDPMATGVLPVCVGKAARIMDYLNFDLKEYLCTLKLGLITDTQDIWGNVLEERPVNVTEDEIREAFSVFKGKMEQYPPMYSAVRIEGKHLYEYARKGEEPPKDVKKRRIYIESLDILSIDLDAFEVSFRVRCSKGTYIRTICQDVGEALGCGATMTSLTRSATGILNLENSITLEDLEDKKWDAILPTDYPLVHFGKVIVNQVSGIRFIAGWHVSLGECLEIEHPKKVDENLLEFIDEDLLKAYKVYMKTDEGIEFVGVARFSDKYHKLVAHKVFYRSKNDESI